VKTRFQSLPFKFNLQRYTLEDVSFAVVSEYTPPKDAARARSIFADGRKRVLLVTVGLYSCVTHPLTYKMTR
jgi:hypothetical protein